MRRFGELEAVIMDRLWEQGRPMLVREMVEDLRGDRPLAYTTVMTVMENLHRKGWLRRERDGRAWRYEPTGSRSGYTAALMNEALGTSTDHFGVVLAKGNPLTACVNTAISTLRSNGTLKRLQQQWLAKATGAPILK